MKININFKFVFILTLLIATFTVVQVSAKGFVHAPVIMVDGEEYYMAGAPDGPDGATDIPGHEWVQAAVVVIRCPRWQLTLYCAWHH